MMGYRLKFAPHLGFPTPDCPLFPSLAEGTSPEAQIAFAVAQGFKCIQDPFAARRSFEQQQAIGVSAAAAGLAVSCFVYAPVERASQTGWLAMDAAGRAALDSDIEEAVGIGRRLGSQHIAVLTGFSEDRSLKEQGHALTENLARSADRVAAAGMTLNVEAVNSHRLPQMLLHHFADAVDVVRNAAHPAVRLIFDTAHLQAMDGDVLGNMDRAWDLIELIQLADHPGRVEPGQGELNFETIIDEIERRGFSGPVELEHGWASPGLESERRYLQWLDRWSDGETEAGRA